MVESTPSQFVAGGLLTHWLQWRERDEKPPLNCLEAQTLQNEHL